MKPAAQRGQSIGALWAGFRGEQPGSRAFWRDRPFPDRTRTPMVVTAAISLQHPQSPDARTMISPLISDDHSGLAPVTAKRTPILSPLGF